MGQAMGAQHLVKAAGHAAGGAVQVQTEASVAHFVGTGNRQVFSHIGQYVDINVNGKHPECVSGRDSFMPQINTCLWYDGTAEQAAEFYATLLPGSGIVSMSRPAPDSPPVLVYFTLAGQPYWGLNGGPGHPHSFAASIACGLDSQDQADTLYDKLIDAGGTESMCGWVQDQFGIWWQVIPPGMPDALFGEDTEANQRAFAEMQTQKKLNVAAIIAARDAI